MVHYVYDLVNKKTINSKQMKHANLSAAAHVLLIKNNEILLMKRANTGFMDEYWSVPAGRIDSGEMASLAAIREANEEVGVNIAPIKLSRPLIMHHHNEKGDRIYFFFLCNCWKEEPKNVEPHKCSELKWFSVTSLPKNIVPHVGLAIKKILRGETYVEYGFK